MMNQAMERALKEFTDYFVQNYPGPRTIIGDPQWHAPKIFKAAAAALDSARAETWDEIHCPHCGSTDWYTLDAGSHHCRGCNKDFGCAARAEGEPPQREPDGYAYRYPAISFSGSNVTVIRFETQGREINGCKPIETIPYYMGTPPSAGEQAAPGDSASIAAFAIEDVDRVMWTKAMPIDDAIDLMRAALTAPVPLAHDLNCEYSKWGTKCTCAAPVKDGRQETPK